MELAVSAERRIAPTPRRASNTTPYVDIKMTLKRVERLEPLPKLLQHGRTLSLYNRQDDSELALG